MQIDAGPPCPALANKGSRQNRSVIDHQQITRAQQIGQISNDMIRQACTRRVQKPGGLTRAGGFLGNQLFGQMIVKVSQLTGLVRHGGIRLYR